MFDNELLCWVNILSVGTLFEGPLLTELSRKVLAVWEEMGFRGHVTVNGGVFLQGHLTDPFGRVERGISYHSRKERLPQLTLAILPEESPCPQSSHACLCCGASFWFRKELHHPNYLYCCYVVCEETPALNPFC